MGKKPMTVAEMARMGGWARAARYTREQLRQERRPKPAKLDGRARRRPRQLSRPIRARPSAPPNWASPFAAVARMHTA